MKAEGVLVDAEGRYCNDILIQGEYIRSCAIVCSRIEKFWQLGKRDVSRPERLDLGRKDCNQNVGSPRSISRAIS